MKKGIIKKIINEKKTILSIVFVLTIIITIASGTSILFQNIKGTRSISKSECELAGGVTKTLLNQTYCCPNGYTNAIHLSGYIKDSGMAICSKRYKLDSSVYTNSADTYFGKYFVRESNTNSYYDKNGFLDIGGSFPVYRTKVSDSRYNLKKNLTDINTLITAWEKCSSSDDECRDRIEKQLEDKPLSDRKNYNYCDSLFNDSKVAWKTYDCTTYFERGIFGIITKYYLYCDCMPSSFEYLYSEVDLKPEGAGCYRQSNGIYKWILNANATSGMQYVPSVSSSSECDAKTLEEKQTYTLTFNSNGGNTISPSVGEKGHIVTLPKATRDGYVFEGWYTQATGGTLIGKSGEKYTITGNVVVFAHWIQTYTITFDTNGGDKVSAKTEQKNAKITLPEANKSGNEFKGWYTKASGGTLVGKPGDTYTVTKDVTLYAQWNVISTPPIITPPSTPTPEPPTTYTYSLNYDPNGGTIIGKNNASCSTTSSNCKIENLPTATRDGHIFKGWGKSKTCTLGKTDFLTISSQNEKYYACWEAREYTFKVTFNANGGMINGDAEKSCETTNTKCMISGLPTATRSGYKFKGWGKNSSCTSGETDYISISSQNEKYYACWEKTEVTYRVTFDPNTGILNGISEQSCITKEDICILEQLPTATKEGYIFNGWSTEPSCLYGNVETLTLVELTSKYYACWLKTVTEPVIHTVTFYNGTSIIETSQCTVPEGEALCKVSSPTNQPARYNKKFTGWGDNEGCTSGQIADIDVYQTTNKYACFADIQLPEKPVEKESNSPVALYIILAILAIGIIGAGVWFLWKVKKSNTNY